jgi:hypothetical protein
MEKALATFVVFLFALTSISIFVIQRDLLTKEEAIKISKNSELVQSLLENADRYTLEVHYLNKTQNGKDNGVWYITWYIHPTGAVSGFSYVVGHSIDGETGQILDEGSASLR